MILSCHFPTLSSFPFQKHFPCSSEPQFSQQALKGRPGPWVQVLSSLAYVLSCISTKIIISHFTAWPLEQTNGKNLNRVVSKCFGSRKVLVRGSNVLWQGYRAQGNYLIALDSCQKQKTEYMHSLVYRYHRGLSINLSDQSSSLLRQMRGILHFIGHWKSIQMCRSKRWKKLWRISLY
jgi:hypothetical protein